MNESEPLRSGASCYPITTSRLDQPDTNGVNYDRLTRPELEDLASLTEHILSHLQTVSRRAMPDTPRPHGYYPLSRNLAVSRHGSTTLVYFRVSHRFCGCNSTNLAWGIGRGCRAVPYELHQAAVSLKLTLPTCHWPRPICASQ
jgi:hypothetical protein